MKHFKIVVVLLVGISALFTSCENFLSGEEVKTQLEKQIEYANLPYVQIEIKSYANATNSIVPAVGDYVNTYKKGGVIKK